MKYERQSQFELPPFEPKPYVFSMIKPAGVAMADRIDEMLAQLGTVTVRTGVTATRQLVEQHYSHLRQKVGESGRYFLEPIVRYYEGQQVLPFVLEAHSANVAHTEFVAQVRHLAGKSRPIRTHKGQIRHLPLETGQPFMFVQGGVDPETNEPFCFDNLIHVSDCPRAALGEIALWFAHYPDVVERYRDYFIQLDNKES